jgi:hypothetical protein
LKRRAEEKAARRFILFEGAFGGLFGARVKRMTGGRSRRVKFGRVNRWSSCAE